MCTRHLTEVISGHALRTLAVAGVLALAGTAVAVPQIESTYGGQNPYLAADVNAMGGTGVAMYRGGLSGLFNPAFLIDAGYWRVDLAAAVDHADEDRFQPLFDTFENYVTDTVIASNRHDHFPGGLSAARGLRLGNVPVAIGLALADRNEFGYVFDEELRSPDPYNNRDAVLQNRTYKVVGTLHDLGLGAAAAVTSAISVGATLHYAFGSRDTYVSDRYTQDVTQSFEITDRWDLSGVNATFGGRVHVSERVDVGLAYDLPLKVDGDRAIDTYGWSAVDTAYVTTTTSGSASVRYPGQYRAGFTLYPRNDPRTIVSAELLYCQWSKLEGPRAALGSTMSGNPGELQDVFDVRLGVQHTFYNGMRAMFGFRHYDSYADRDAGTVVFTAGAGMPVAGGALLASVELSKLQSIQPHIFAYPAGFTTDPEARVEDTRFRVGLGFSRDF